MGSNTADSRQVYSRTDGNRSTRMKPRAVHPVGARRILRASGKMFYVRGGKLWLSVWVEGDWLRVSDAAACLTEMH